MLPTKPSHDSSKIHNIPLYISRKSAASARQYRHHRKQVSLKKVSMRYTVIVEHGESGWGAHVPDLPGCIAAGGTREEALHLIREAIELHIEGLREEACRFRSLGAKAKSLRWEPHNSRVQRAPLRGAADAPSRYPDPDTR